MIWGRSYKGFVLDPLLQEIILRSDKALKFLLNYFNHQDDAVCGQFFKSSADLNSEFSFS